MIRDQRERQTQHLRGSVVLVASADGWNITEYLQQVLTRRANDSERSGQICPIPVKDETSVSRVHEAVPYDNRVSTIDEKGEGASPGS